MLDILPKDADTYILRLCADMNVKGVAELGRLSKSFRTNLNYQNAVEFGTPEQRANLEELLRTAEETLSSNKKKVHRNIKIAAFVAIGFLLVVTVGTIVFKTQRIESALSAAEKKQTMEIFWQRTINYQIWKKHVNKILNLLHIFLQERIIVKVITLPP